MSSVPPMSLSPLIHVATLPTATPLHLEMKSQTHHLPVRCNVFRLAFLNTDSTTTSRKLCGPATVTANPHTSTLQPPSARYLQLTSQLLVVVPFHLCHPQHIQVVTSTPPFARRFSHFLLALARQCRHFQKSFHHHMCTSEF